MYAAHAQKKRKEASEEELTKCLTLIEKAASDNDRFSAMLEITKQIRSNTFTEDDRKVILQTMGLEFLSRLIKTTSLPKGCSNNLYKSIALSLLSTLCSEESVVLQPEMKPFLIVINDVLQNREQDLPEKEILQQMNSDGLAILSHMVKHQQGVDQVVRTGIFNTLLDTITSPNCCDTLKIFSLIGTIVKHRSRLFIEDTEKLFTIMNIAAQRMSRGSDMKEKMEYAKAATLILNHTPEVEYDRESDWVHSMTSVVLKLIPVKLVPEFSEAVFYLLSAIVTRLSVHVLVLNGSHQVNTIKALIARIAVEIYMLLDGIGPDNATERYPRLDQVYKLLSEMVHFICGDFGETADADTIISLYRKLVDISNTIMEFLISIANQEVDLPRNHGVVLVTVRVLAAMLTEVTEDPTPALLKLIPFFNLLCQNIEYADDVKLEVKNVTQAALENIKLMNMKPEQEESFDTVVSSASDTQSNQKLQRDGTSSRSSFSSQNIQHNDDLDSSVASLSDLHLTDSSPKMVRFSDETDQIVSPVADSDSSHQQNGASNDSLRRVEAKGDIHTTLFYVPKGTKGDNWDESVRPGHNACGETLESDQESEAIDSSSVELSQEKIEEFFYIQRILKEEEDAKQRSERQRIRPLSSHQRRKRHDSSTKQEDSLDSSNVWNLTPDDILGFLLPSYMYLLEHNETIKVMVKCDLFQTVVNFIQRSTSEILEGRSSAIPESTTINALKVINHFYECHPDIASTQLCLLDLMELFILSLPNLVSVPHPPPLTCLKMIEVCLLTLLSNSGIRKRKSALHRIKHSRYRFFKAVVDYLSSFYEFRQNRRRYLTLYIKEEFKDKWETACDYWCGCMEGIRSLIKTEEVLQETMVKTSMLSCFMAFLAQHSDSENRKLPESTQKIIEQILSLIESAADSSNAMRGFIIQCKGMLIARKYGLEKMEGRLNQHVGRDSY